MRTSLTLVLGLLFSCGGTAEAFTITTINPTSYSDAAAGLNGPNAVFEDFEDATLVNGLTFEWVNPPGGNSGVQTSLPNLWQPVFVYPDNSQAWDGQHVLTNVDPNAFNSNRSERTDFFIAGGTDRFGIGISNVEFGGRSVSINGGAQTGPIDIYATGANQSTFLLIEAGAGETINSVSLTFGSGDSIMFDHLGFNAAPAVPEPSTYLLLLLSGLGVQTLRKRG